MTYGTKVMDLLGALYYLTERDRDQILQLCSEAPFTAGQFLLRQGAVSTDMLVLMEGSATVQLATGAGGGKDVGALRPGDLVGEMSFITGEPASASILGQRDGRLLRIPHSVLEGLCQQEGGFGTRLYQSLSLLLAQRLHAVNASRAHAPGPAATTA